VAFCARGVNGGCRFTSIGFAFAHLPWMDFQGGKGDAVMATFEARFQKRRWGMVLVSCTLLALLALSSTMVDGQQAKVDVLRIGTSGSLVADRGGDKEKSALASLKDFIKDETGLDNQIERQKDWRELVQKMTKGELHLGVFQGYEFAWAQPDQPKLKPLALAVNRNIYPTAHLVTQHENKAKSFADLQGQSFAIPATGQGYLRLYVDHECQAAGKKVEDFFSKITYPEDIEAAIDDVVDGITQAMVVDKATLQAYKTRKPTRFMNLKQVAESQKFPPALVAYYDGVLDKPTLKRFQNGLLNASKKDRGQTTLTLFRLTEFKEPPDDFDKVLAETRKNYPPPTAKTK
jgi:ABC-type phosphate/phosphonate transport system substrate-binding protein